MYKVFQSGQFTKEQYSFPVNSIVSSDPLEISNHIMQFYKNLYLEQFTWRPKLDGLHFNSLEEDEDWWLERPFWETEVCEVVTTMNGKKANSVESLMPVNVCIVD